jgi:hypothetical protein
MTTTELQNVEIPRDRYGRPMVMPAKGTKRVAYRRTTTFVGCLDDTYGLQKWKARMVASAWDNAKTSSWPPPPPPPTTRPQAREDRRQGNRSRHRIRRRHHGTALHSFTERLDRGQPLGYVPHEAEADLAAYQAATAGIEWLGIEAFRVHDDWKVAGTADRIGRDNTARSPSTTSKPAASTTRTRWRCSSPCTPA